MTLPLLPKDRNWSPETWRAGLDEAVRLVAWPGIKTYRDFDNQFAPHGHEKTIIIAHATTLLDAGIVKPVVNEAAVAWDNAQIAYRNADTFPDAAAIAVIDAALDKARAGE